MTSPAGGVCTGAALGRASLAVDVRGGCGVHARARRGRRGQLGIGGWDGGRARGDGAAGGLACSRAPFWWTSRRVASICALGSAGACARVTLALSRRRSAPSRTTLRICAASCDSSEPSSPFSSCRTCRLEQPICSGGVARSGLGPDPTPTPTPTPNPNPNPNPNQVAPRAHAPLSSWRPARRRTVRWSRYRRAVWARSLSTRTTPPACPRRPGYLP